MSTKKITFVCTGNTCRSVIAEKLFKKMIKGSAAGDVEVSSAGTSVMGHYSIFGDLLQVLEEKGVSHEGHAPRMIDSRIMSESDLILVMTREHKQSLNSRFPGYEDKVRLLSEYADGRVEDIPDPIGRGVAAYRQAYTVIEDYLIKIKERLENELKG